MRDSSEKSFGIFLIILMVVLCITWLPAEAKAFAAVSGTCGADLTWALDEEGTLTISGSGAMTEYGMNKAPWQASNAAVKCVIIEDNVTSICEYAFYDYPNLSSEKLTEIKASPDNHNYSSDTQGVLHDKNKTMILQASGAIETYMIPHGITTLYRDAFTWCGNLTAVTIIATVTNIEAEAFFGCSELKQISISTSVNVIKRGAFSHCTNLKSVHITDVGAWCRINAVKGASHVDLPPHFEFFSVASWNPLHYGGKLYLDGELLTEMVIPEEEAPDTVPSSTDATAPICAECANEIKLLSGWALIIALTGVICLLIAVLILINVRRKRQL